jgi:two-component system, cell cycle sensor histidine kinase and response regulator CckA
MSAVPTSAPRPLVVVVDDAHALRLVMSRALINAGYDVLTAPDGYSATLLIQGLRTPPDLVVTDLRMPLMRGEALAAWLGTRHPHLPVVFVTGFGAELDEPLPGLLLHKPFTPETLQVAVRDALAHARKASA